jgi:hypothetical protein
MVRPSFVITDTVAARDGAGAIELASRGAHGSGGTDTMPVRGEASPCIMTVFNIRILEEFLDEQADLGRP